MSHAYQYNHVCQKECVCCGSILSLLEWIHLQHTRMTVALFFQCF